jgi:secreted PhoX family phosphatase
MAMPTRRVFLRLASSVSLGFLGLHRYCQGADPEYQSGSPVTDELLGYGPLMPDPAGVLDLPAGFSYQIISRMGETMDDGFVVPGKHDGMATFAAGAGRTIIVRNHECEAQPPELGAFGANYELLPRVPRSRLYDWTHDHRPPLGGTTTLIYNTQTQQLERHFLSLAGTLRNCAGGPTPWGSWISCEETVDKADKRLLVDHGYNFEVPADLSSLVEPVPLFDMGRFRHEAVAIEPRSGIVFETEDMDDGLIYRYLPHQPGDLKRGGRLQALAVRGQPSRDTRNWPEGPDPIPTGQALETEWIDIEHVRAPDDDLRYRGFAAGAARFARGEGMWYGRDCIYFACTSGGSARLGQIWRYVPSPREGQPEEMDQPGKLELFIESHHEGLIEHADNLTIAPWGDLFVCEDGKASQHVVGVTPEGKCYRLAHNAMNECELAGVTFAPDGSTVFVNIQRAGVTCAIWGPWRSRRGLT